MTSCSLLRGDGRFCDRLKPVQRRWRFCDWLQPLVELRGIWLVASCREEVRGFLTAWNLYMRWKVLWLVSACTEEVTCFVTSCSLYRRCKRFDDCLKPLEEVRGFMTDCILYIGGEGSGYCVQHWEQLKGCVTGCTMYRGHNKMCDQLLSVQRMWEVLWLDSVCSEEMRCFVTECGPF